jgi:hypothetical protein
MWIYFWSRSSNNDNASLIFKVFQILVRIRMAMEKDKFSYNNYKSAIKDIYKLEGLGGFYRGYLASIAGITIYHGTGFFIFTKIK